MSVKKHKKAFLHARFCIFFALACTLFYADYHQNPRITPLRSALARITEPFLHAVNWPSEFEAYWLAEFREKSRLQNENARLNLQVITLKAGEQRVKSLEAENKQLLSLLRETETMSDQFLGAQLLSVNTSDYTDEIVINKGGSEHVTLGQSVIDSSGLMGQVIQVWPNTSRVLLITDRRSAVPVQVQRNGLRAIALGNGQQGLRIENLLKTADIQAGDILVTSGLGKRFPKGYPVGKVTRVLQNEGSQFLAVSIAPLAAIDRSQEVLLISAGGQHA